MSRRAEQVDETRQRIVDAAVRLHGTVGPAATTIAGIAEEAGVTRLTVYRHFADEEALFEACSADWLSRQRPPDPSRWADLADPEQRLRIGLADIYRFYRAGADMLYHVNRDIDALSSARQEFLRDRDRQLADRLAGSASGPASGPASGSATASAIGSASGSANKANKATPGTPAERRRRRAVIGHAVSFWTWWSLCQEFGLSDRDAIDVLVTAILG